MSLRDIIESYGQRLAEMERKLSGMIRQGPVAQVDAARQRVRLEIGQGDDGPVLGPWVPYAQQGGALAVHTPPTARQNMMMVSPSGDPQQAVALPYTFSDQHKSPSQSPSENVLTYAGATFKLDASGLSISKGGVTVTITAAGLEVTGGDVKNDGKSIGKNHKHTGVESGSDQTGEPA